MEIYIPVMGLSSCDEGDFSDIQLLEQDGFKEIGETDFNRITFPTIEDSIGNLLHIISGIYYKREGRSIKANFEFPGISDPRPFNGQKDLYSIGLGLMTKLYYDKEKNNIKRALFEKICITGTINLNPSTSMKINGDFLTQNTISIKEKLTAFTSFLLQNNLQAKKTAFIYCGSETEDELTGIVKSAALPNCTIKRITHFNELGPLLFQMDKHRKPGFLKKIKSTTVVLTLGALIIGSLAGALGMYRYLTTDIINQWLLEQIKIISWNNVDEFKNIWAEGHEPKTELTPFLFPLERLGDWIKLHYQKTIYYNKKKKSAIRIHFNPDSIEAYGGWGVKFLEPPIEFTRHEGISFMLKGTGEQQNFEFKLKDRQEKEMTFSIKTNNSDWEKQTIPFSYFSEINLNQLDNFNFGFNGTLGSVNVYIDEFAFY